MDLFSTSYTRTPIAPGAVLLHGFALNYEAELISEIERIAAASPFRKMTVPSGHTMSVAMTNCGRLGWVTDKAGYRYESTDPLSGKPWPLMQASFKELAGSAAETAGYKNFQPSGCLINRYEPGAKMSLHQDKDEKDVKEPIVSVSLGLPATFLFGGATRTDKAKRIALDHGDVVVWGGPSRLFFHGIAPLKVGTHRRLNDVRINLTFRKVAP